MEEPDTNPPGGSESNTAGEPSGPTSAEQRADREHYQRAQHTAPTVAAAAREAARREEVERTRRARLARAEALADRQLDAEAELLLKLAESPAYIGGVTATVVVDASFWVSPAALNAIHDAGFDAAV